MTSAELSALLPYLLPVAAASALIGWWLRGKKKTPAPAPLPGKAPTAPSNSERQRLRDLESKLRSAESAAQSAQSEIASLRAGSISKADHEALRAELDSARTNVTALDAQLKKSRDVQAGLQAQANDAGKKNQARAITLENELAAARTEIQRLKTLADPTTDGMKRLEGEVETVRTRLRAVEAQLAERNAELNALKARALSATTRAPRTIAASTAAPGSALNLLGIETDPLPTITTPAPSGTADAIVENPVAARLSAATEATVAAAAAAAEPDPEAAFTSASAILGKRIQSDDLTVIEGIGPKISELLQAANIGTWSALADAQPEQIEAILAAAGPVYAVHNPGTWPSQARLAADAKWFQLKSLQEKLHAGRPPETALA
ncbi:MAG: hypothetical protein JWL81_2381 [Verrucomicrobiales bacterium]|nr:hypothetical protein [Verrucomicrobiales bacterium]